MTIAANIREGCQYVTSNSSGFTISWGELHNAEQFARIVKCDIVTRKTHVLSIRIGGTSYELTAIGDKDKSSAEFMSECIAWLEAHGVDVKSAIENYDTWKS
jgi:hypothetical protein